MDLLTQLGAQLATQLADPFRIGLVIALIATAERTREATGTLVPLLLGAGFIAVLIPLTTQAGAAGLDLRAMATGFGANLILVAVALGIWRLVQRLR